MYPLQFISMQCKELTRAKIVNSVKFSRWSVFEI